MSHVCIDHNPDLYCILQKAHESKHYDDLLDESTPSKPAVWDRASQSLYRVHLESDNPQLEECKCQIRSIKEAIKAQLIEEYGPYTWKSRMPFDQLFE